MPTVMETARVTAPGGREGATQIVQDAFLLWTSVVNECKRRRIPISNDSYMYRHPLSTHVDRLWPTLHSDERTTKSRELYQYLRDTGNAVCVNTHNPTVWRIAATWNEVQVDAIVRYRMTRAERRVTPREAGEDLPEPEVTLRTKEKQQVTDTQTEAEVRRELVQALLSEHKEPLVLDEIAYALGVRNSAVRDDLRYLTANGVVHTRIETAEERSLRFGGVAARASRAKLHSTKSPVPQRTKREVIDGYVKEQVNVDRVMSTHEIERRLACKFNKAGARFRFTVTSLAESTGVSSGTLAARVRDMEQLGLIEFVKHQAAAKVYKIKNKPKLLEHLHFQPELPQPAETPTPPTPTPPVLHSTVVSGAGNPLARVSEVLDENERLREEVHNLKNRIAKLEADAAVAAMDAEALKRLEAWTPST